MKGKVPVNPTEDPEKVRTCITNIFPDAEPVRCDHLLEFTTDSLDAFVNKVTDQKIRNTSIMVLESGLHDDSTVFSLNKQACAVERVNFTDQGTLGVVRIEVKEGAKELIDMLDPDPE
ncbi:MAG: RNA-binding domain-containing protein [Thermoplasmatota archaeon]